jgi:hypothetical protein
MAPMMAHPTPEVLEPYARMALDAVHRPYPNQVVHLLRDDADAQPPRRLTPVFFGCFDWHSAVHGHWCLVRALRCHPQLGCAAEVRAALRQSFTAEGIAGERAYLEVPQRAAFERPYGLSWLLQLCAELHEWDDGDAKRWRIALAPLESLAASRLHTWLGKLAWPIRSGEHSQSAFALGLVHDWARAAGDAALAEWIGQRARALYGGDVEAPIAYEPSGHDFLSPILAEADLMRRVMDPEEFAFWFDRFLPDLAGPPALRWLSPAEPVDRADGKLAHLDGLNLSRAWMLEAIRSALPEAHAARERLEGAAQRHREVGLRGALSEHYAGRHWLGSFATYLLTARGQSSM